MSVTPRGARPEDREELRALVGKVFRPNLMDEYPQLFHDGNLRNCRISEEDGKIVSHVGMTIQDAAIFGNRIRVACIGGVGTDPEYRGKGHATACFEDAGRVAREQGVDLMMVSGDRKLYRLAGCRGVGPGAWTELTRDAAQGIPADGFSLRRATLGDIDLLGAMHRAEPVHWFRPPDTWQRSLDCGWVMNRLSNFWIVERAHAAYAYFVLAEPGTRDASPWVSEYAGDRRALFSAFGIIVRERELASVRWFIPGWSRMWAAIVGEYGLEMRSSHTSGTYLIVNFAQLAERMKPYLSEFLGTQTTARLSFRDGASPVVALGGERFTLRDKGCAAHFLFGTLEERRTPAPSEGELGSAYARAFPLPALWYGLNYV